jgi:S1-C subfamily serine protease
VLFLFVGACERVPDWQARRVLEEPQQEWRTFEALESRLWTCRGRLNPQSSQNNFGNHFQNFLESYRESGISLVSDASGKSLLGSALYWDDPAVLVAPYFFSQQATEIECRQETTPWLAVSRLGEDGPTGLVLFRIDDKKAGSATPKGRLHFREKMPVLGEELQVLSAPHRSVVMMETVQAIKVKGNLLTGMDESFLWVTPAVGAAYIGGILADLQGRFLGWVSSSHTDLSWTRVLRVDQLQTIIEAILKDGKMSRPYWGLRMLFDEKRGFVVQEVEVGGIAYAAGIRANDVIKKWNEQELTRLSDWSSEDRLQTGDSIGVLYERNSKSFETRLSFQ